MWAVITKIWYQVELSYLPLLEIGKGNQVAVYISRVNDSFWVHWSCLNQSCFSLYLPKQSLYLLSILFFSFWRHHCSYITWFFFIFLLLFTYACIWLLWELSLTFIFTCSSYLTLSIFPLMPVKNSFQETVSLDISYY